MQFLWNACILIADLEKESLDVIASPILCGTMEILEFGLVGSLGVGEFYSFFAAQILH